MGVKIIPADFELSEIPDFSSFAKPSDFDAQFSQDSDYIAEISSDLNLDSCDEVSLSSEEMPF